MLRPRRIDDYARPGSNVPGERVIPKGDPEAFKEAMRELGDGDGLPATGPVKTVLGRNK